MPAPNSLNFPKAISSHTFQGKPSVGMGMLAQFHLGIWPADFFSFLQIACSLQSPELIFETATDGRTQNHVFICNYRGQDDDVRAGCCLNQQKLSVR